MTSEVRKVVTPTGDSGNVTAGFGPAGGLTWCGAVAVSRTVERAVRRAAEHAGKSKLPACQGEIRRKNA